MIKRVIGMDIAVKDIDTAAKKYSEVLGVKPTPLGPEEFAFPGHRGAMFQLGDVTINLITSEQPDTTVANFIETKGEGLFAVGLESTDIERDMEELAKKGIKLVTDKPLPTASAKIGWVHPKPMHGIMFALFQPKAGWPPVK